MSNTPKSITVAYGDGIGPEIMEATLKILGEAKANIKIDTIEVGKRMYEMGHNSGLAPNAWETLKRNKVLLKAPITTPQGGGYKSLNVTIRKTLGLYANVRPCKSFHPYVRTLHPEMDLVIIRENEEDIYSGIEHRQTDQMVQSLKLISRQGCERIIRYAFEYAVQNGREKVTCMSKDNIMKMADGLFHKVFDEIGKEYPNIEQNHFIIDIGAARIASKPDVFDVIVTENLYGDIISDIAAEVCGSVGLAGSSNIGEDFAMFEAIHGSAPDIAGKNIANPSGLLSAAIMMLVHIGDAEAASRIHNAWFKTLEDGIHTGDIYDPASSKEKVGTQEFSQAVIERLGQRPHKFAPVAYTASEQKTTKKAGAAGYKKAKKELMGVDVFVDWNGVGGPKKLADTVAPLAGNGLKLSSITVKGLKVWPAEISDLPGIDHWCCRFMSTNGAIKHEQISSLLHRLGEADVDFIKTDNLYNFDGERGYSMGQGE